MPADRPSNARQQADPPKRVSPWEWVAAAVSLVILGATLGFLTWQLFQENGTAPQIVLEVDSIAPAGNGFIVEFTARNLGGSTAAGLHVAAELIEAGSPVETSQTVIDFVPARGRRGAGLFFTGDPRRGGLLLRPLGYDRP